ncbi:MAG: Clp1/GlmU family protein [Candidatus Bathyarchaeia archaeon]
MQETVESNKTILVDGPASVKLVSGRVEVFGCPVKPSQKVVIREGKRLPFLALEKAVLDISLGPNAAMQEIAGSSIPNSWSKPFESILAFQKRPIVVLVLGKIDSGKSSYCTYLVNKLVDCKCRVAVLDGDLDQSDIGPSGTVSYAIASKPVTDLYDLKLENAYFVGVTSPITAIAKTIEGLSTLKAEILLRCLDFVVVNTDGWVEGDSAVQYKTALVKELKPDVIIGVQAADELKALIANVGQHVFTVDLSLSLSPRTLDKRKSLREMTYARYLKDAKLQNYPVTQVTIEPRGALPKNQTPDKGMLVGLYGSGIKFLGIGVLREINQLRRALKVQTAVSVKPSRIVVGKICLDEKLREIQD